MLRTAVLWMLAALFGAASVSGCKKKKEAETGKSRATVQDDLPWPACTLSRPQETLTGCTSWGCGSNGPTIGNEEYELEHVRSFDGTGNPTIQNSEKYFNPSNQNDARVATLSISDGTFKANGRPIDPANEKYWFELHLGGKQCVFKIESVEAIEPWVGGGASIPAYTLHYANAAQTAVPLCREKKHWGNWRNPQRDAGPPGAPTDAALLVIGERYEPPTAAIKPESNGEYNSWFNIACAGSALSKMRLMGLDPETQTAEADIGDRQTVLKLLTATYCVTPPDGEARTKNWTVLGQPLGIRCTGGSPGCNFTLVPPGKSIDASVPEAYWNSDGSTCFTHTRLWSDSSTPSDPGLDPKCKGKGSPQDPQPETCENAIRSACKPDGGPSFPACGDDVPKWSTYPIEHEHPIEAGPG